MLLASTAFAQAGAAKAAAKEGALYNTVPVVEFFKPGRAAPAHNPNSKFAKLARGGGGGGGGGGGDAPGAPKVSLLHRLRKQGLGTAKTAGSVLVFGSDIGEREQLRHWLAPEYHVLGSAEHEHAAELLARGKVKFVVVECSDKLQKEANLLLIEVRRRFQKVPVVMLVPAFLGAAARAARRKQGRGTEPMSPQCERLLARACGEYGAAGFLRRPLVAKMVKDRITMLLASSAATDRVAASLSSKVALGHKAPPSHEGARPPADLEGAVPKNAASASRARAFADSGGQLAAAGAVGDGGDADGGGGGGGGGGGAEKMLASDREAHSAAGVPLKELASALRVHTPSGGGGKGADGHQAAAASSVWRSNVYEDIDEARADGRGLTAIPDFGKGGKHFLQAQNNAAAGGGGRRHRAAIQGAGAGGGAPESPSSHAGASKRGGLGLLFVAAAQEDLPGSSSGGGGGRPGSAGARGARSVAFEDGGSDAGAASAVSARPKTAGPRPGTLKRSSTFYAGQRKHDAVIARAHKASSAHPFTLLSLSEQTKLVGDAFDASQAALEAAPTVLGRVAHVALTAATVPPTPAALRAQARLATVKPRAEALAKKFLRSQQLQQEEQQQQQQQQQQQGEGGFGGGDDGLGLGAGELGSLTGERDGLTSMQRSHAVANAAAARGDTAALEAEVFRGKGGRNLRKGMQRGAFGAKDKLRSKHAAEAGGAAAEDARPATAHDLLLPGLRYQPLLDALSETGAHGEWSSIVYSRLTTD